MTPISWALLVGIIALVVTAVARRKPRAAPRQSGPPRRIVVDGTNVLFWDGNAARLETLQKVVSTLRKRGYVPLIFLDASSRHHIKDPSMGRRQFARALGTTKSHVMVCPKGTEADAYLLSYAQVHKHRVVSNDRFRDRPHAARNVKLVKGHFQDGRLVLKGL